MRLTSFICLLSWACVVVGGTPLGAQAPRFAVDAVAGVGHGSGGPPAHFRTGFASHALLAIGRPGGSTVWAGSLGWQGPGPRAGTCTLEANGKCRPDFWSFSSFGLLWGGHQESPGGSTRELVGPMVFQTDGSKTVGIDARLDAAFRTVPHMRFVIAAKGSVLPRFRGRTYFLGAVMIGLRLQ